MGGVGGRAPFFSDFFRKFLKVTVFRVVLCNYPKDVHVLWVSSEIGLSLKIFLAPLSEFSRSAPAM